MRPLAALVLLALTGCTVIHTATVAAGREPPDVVVTAGDLPEPYESLGLLQVTRSGVLLFGFADLVGTDLQAGFQQALIPEVRRLGGDAAIHVRFHQTQYLRVTRALGALFFIFPLPSEVTLSAEVVKRRPPGAPPAEAPR